MADDFVDKLPRPLAAAFLLVRDTVVEFGQDKASRLAAALAYYAAFSIAPLLLVVIAVVGLFWEAEEASVQARLIDELAGLIGPDGAGVIRTMLESTSDTGTGTIATIAGVAGLVWGATRLFAQLQGALNDIWNVQPKPGGGIMRFVMTRVLSFSMVLVLGLLLLLALVVSAMVAALNDFLVEYLPIPISLLEIGNHVIAVAVITLLFAAIYRILPDVDVRWRDVWVGAFITAVMFNLGKYGISIYLATTATASAYGAAGSFVLLLLWIYFSSIIFFFGAEFTQVYARHFGRRIKPAAHAIHVAPMTAGVVDEARDEESRDDESRDARPPQPARTVPAAPDDLRIPIWKRALPLVAAFLVGRMMTKKD